MVKSPSRPLFWPLLLMLGLLCLAWPAAAQDDGSTGSDTPGQAQAESSQAAAESRDQAPAGQAMPSGQAMPTATTPPSSLQVRQDRPRLLLTPDKVRRLRELAKFRTYRWRRLLSWALEPAREGASPKEGPGLALAALVLAEEHPQQAAKLRRLAARCALNGARNGLVDKVERNVLLDHNQLRDPAEMYEQGYRFLAPDSGKDAIIRVGRFTPTRLVPEGGQEPLEKLTAKGRTYLLLLEDLNRAAVVGQAVALTLDWAWDAFQPEERKAVAAWLLAQARLFKDQGLGCFDSASAAALNLSGLAGLAAWGLDPRAEATVKDAYENRYLNHIRPCLINAGQGGGWFEGTSSGASAGLNLLVFALAAQSAGGVQLAPENAWFEQRLAYLIFAQLPGVANTLRGAYRSYFPCGDPVMAPPEMGDLMRLQMAACLNLNPGAPLLGVARALVLDRRTPSVTENNLLAYEFLWVDPAGSTAPLATAPLAHAATGVGQAFLRSDWSDRATWLGFSSGPHFAYRQHLDATGLTIYRLGDLMPRGGAWDGPTSSHALNYAIRSVAYNTIQVVDPQEYSWYDMRVGPQPKGTYANDGGSRAWALFDDKGQPSKQAPWTAAGWDNGAASYQANRDIYRVASLEAVEDQPRYAYARGDATAAYQGSTHKVERLKRHVFLLRASGPDDAEAQEVVAVVDDVLLAKPGLEVRFAMHFAERPKAAVELNRLGPGRWRGPGRQFEAATRHSKLTAICVWPEKAVLDLYGMEGEAASWAGERNWPPRGRETNAAPWRADFWSAPGEGAAVPMVVALVPDDAGGPEAPQIEALTAGRPDVVGLVVKDPRWPRLLAVRLGRPDDSVITYDYPEGRSRHLVAGLMPDTEYLVEVGPGTITVRPGRGQTSSAAGLLSFKVAPETGARAVAARP